MQNVCINFHIKGSEQWEGDMHFYAGDSDLSDQTVNDIVSAVLKADAQGALGIERARVEYEVDVDGVKGAFNNTIIPVKRKRGRPRKTPTIN